MLKKTIFLDTIPDRSIVMDKAEELTIIGLITRGWAGTRHFTIDARAKQSVCRCWLFILGKDHSVFSAVIEAIHRSPKTGIKARIRSALTDSAVCDIRANWRVEKEARGADAYFSHHTVLLSDRAAAKTAPNLEIKINDVRAGHSASVGKIDEDALFYILSRGLAKQEARDMMVRGFFEAELSALGDEAAGVPVRSAIDNFLSR